jgi:hypothetical protein
VIITVEHIQRARSEHGGFCVSGMRLWCTRHNVEFRKLLQGGYTVEDIERLAPGDAFAQQVIAFAQGDAQ